MSVTNYFLEKALEYRGYGWAVIPLHTIKNGKCTCGNPECESPGKHPRVNGWNGKGYYPDEDQIRKWWSMWPDANVAIITGETSGFIALDVDSGSGGYETLDQLEKEYGPLPNTVRCRTGGGGEHRYFKYKPISNRVKFKTGLDTRSDRGYVVAPGSLHESGKIYEWHPDFHPETTPIAEMPDWLYQIIIKSGKDSSCTRKNRKSSTVKGKKDIFEHGTRHSSLVSLAGTMRNRGMGEEAILTALLAENKERCKPPLGETEVQSIAKSIAKYEPGDNNKQSASQRQSNIQQVLAISNDLTFVMTPEQELYVKIPQSGYQTTVNVEDEAFELWLVREMYEQFGITPSTNQIKDFARIIKATKKASCQREPVYVRVGGSRKHIFHFLANSAWETVEITAEGWRILSDCPVCFRKPLSMHELPGPVAEKAVDEFFEMLNLSGEEEIRILITSWLLAALMPDGPYPILMIQGEQGSAKSTVSRMLKMLIDPSAGPLRSLPKDERDLMIAARNNHVIAYDNLSGMGSWLSDAFCRIATGGGYSTRKLHTDASEIIFNATRPIILNGIEDIARRGDLASRAISIYLPRIPENRRKTEQDLWDQFNALRPALLGELCDIMVTGLQHLESVQLTSYPRMADFARWIVACEYAGIWEPGKFMELFETNQSQMNTTISDSDAVALAVQSFIQKQPGRNWCGSSTELLVELTKEIDERASYQKSWPKAANVLSGRLLKLAPILREQGIEIETGRWIKGKRTITITS